MAVVAISGLKGQSPSATMLLPYVIDQDNVTDVPVSGTYDTTDPPHIQWSWQGSSFVNGTSEIIGSGAWSMVLPALAGGEGTLTVRRSDNTGVTASCLFSLGISIFAIGDSIVNGDHGGTAACVSGLPKRRGWGTATWNDCEVNASNGPWGHVLDYLAAESGLPVLAVGSAVSGSSADHWRQGVSYFDNAIAKFVASGINRATMTYCQYGANDAINGPIQNATTFAAKIAATKADLDIYMPNVAPFVFTMQGQVFSVTNGTLRSQLDAVRNGLRLAVEAGICYMGGVMVNLNQTNNYDSTHPGSVFKRSLAGRMHAALADASLGTNYGRGPRLVSASMNGTRTVTVVVYDRDLVNSISSDVIGHNVYSSGSPVTVSAQVVTGVRTVTLTHSAVTGAPTVSFGSGIDAIGPTDGEVGIVPSITQNLPTGGFTINRPAEPFNVTPTLDIQAWTGGGGGMGGVFTGGVRH